MQIVITGGAGFLGQRLAAVILAQDGVAIDGEHRPLERLKVLDVAPARGLPDDPRLVHVTADLAAPGVLEAVVDDRTDVVFHLAAVESGAAETDFDLGMRADLAGTMALLERCRVLPEPCRLVFASSIAVYGGPVVAGTITDTTHLLPQTSYGVQKAAAELLVMDDTRQGFIDGRSLRLPTVVVSPGGANEAASTWASSMIREPLAGREAICPVARESAMFLLSARRAVDGLLHTLDLSSTAIGVERSIQLPGRTCTVAEMLQTLGEVAGPHVVERVRFAPDARIQSIVDGWARYFTPVRAPKLGFKADASFHEIVEAHVEDELGGRIA